MSPFNWALGDSPLLNGMDWPMAWLMLGLFVVLGGVADVLYHRRDIGSR